MRIFYFTRQLPAGVIATLVATTLFGCAQNPPVTPLPPIEYDYLIGPLDELEVFVWRSPELSRSVTVRPDGKFSSPLVEDLVASGKTSTELAREMEAELSKYVRTPLVTVMVDDFHGVFNTQIRIVGEAQEPQALPYTANISLLDVMIEVGGLTEFAAGNRAKLVRTIRGRQEAVTVRLEDLLEDGDMSANVQMAPGDILIIPETWF